jgi:hypothetical protein
MTPRHWPSLFVAIAISFGVAGLGGALTDLGPWYQQLVKPDWKPPDAAFGVIWSTIFTVCRQCRTQRFVELDLLSVAPTWLGFGGIGFFVAVDCGFDGAFAPLRPGLGLDAAALFGVGERRRGAQLGHVATQPPSPCVAAPERPQRC